MVPNLIESARFLRLLDPQAEQFTFQTFDDSKVHKEERKATRQFDQFARIIEGALDKHSAELSRLNKQSAGVYVTINETALNRSRKAESILRVRAVFADLDGAPIEPVMACALKPHIIVESSPQKYQVFWLVEGLTLDQFKPVQKSIIARFHSDSCVHDLPRVMRVPGFYHCKGEPFQCRIIQCNDHLPRYQAAEIVNEFPIASLASEVKTALFQGVASATPLNSQEFAIPDKITDGEGRESYILKYAGHLRGQGLPQPTIERILLDFNAIHIDPPLEAEVVIDRAKRYEGPEPSPMVNAEWKDAEPIPDYLPGVKPFNADEFLPPTLAPWVKDIAERMQCPIDYLGVAVMVALGSVLGTRIGVRPKQVDTWYEIPNLWGLVVGRSGDKKTPAISEALSPLRMLQDSATMAYQSASGLHHVALQFHKDDLAKKKKQSSKGTYTLTQADYTEPTAPAERRYIVNDTTVEALGLILQDNPTGVLSFSDEIAGLLSRLDGEERRSDRAFYLEAYNGKGSFSVDRITRNRVLIPRLCLSVLGGTQPDLLKAYMKHAVNGGSGNDGLIQRFQLAVYPDRNTGPVKIVDAAPDAAAADQAKKVFIDLDDLDPLTIGAVNTNGTLTLGFDSQAQQRVNEWLWKIESVIRQSKSHPSVVSHYSKYRKTIPTLALIIHLASGGTGPISLDAFEMSIRWMYYLRSHAKRIYAAVTAGQMDSAKTLATRIERGKLNNGFTVRDVVRHGWAQLASHEEVRQAVDALVDFGWLQGKEDSSTGGRPTTRYWIHPIKLRKAA